MDRTASSYSLVSIKNEFGRDMRFCDDGIGKLYALADSMGIVGFVRADSLESAYEIAEDELFPEADMTLSDIAKDLGCTLDDVMDDAAFQEQYGFRPNGPNDTDTIREGIYMRDLNGERLDAVNDAWLARNGYVVTWDVDEQ